MIQQWSETMYNKGHGEGPISKWLANMAQYILLQLEAIGDMPVYQWCGIATSWHSDNNL